MTVLRRWKTHDTTYLEEEDFIWRMKLRKTNRIALHKIAYPASGNQVIAGNTAADCNFKCLDLHNSEHYGLIAEARKNVQQLTKVCGMPLRNQCTEIHLRGVDGLFLLD